MDADPLRDDLLTEFRRLRRGQNSFPRDRLLSSDLLVEFLGAGDLEQACAATTGLIEQHRGDPACDVMAYFHTCGFKTPGDTLEQRLSHYANAFHVDERTALRRSNRGALKLATEYRHTLELDRPWAKLELIQTGPQLSAWITVAVDRGQSWRKPVIFVDGEQLPPLDVEFETDRVVGSHRLKGEVQLPNIELDTDQDHVLAELDVVWPMPIWPLWDVVVNLSDERLFTRTSLRPSGRLEVQILWLNDAAAASGRKGLRPGARY